MADDSELDYEEGEQPTEAATQAATPVAQSEEDGLPLYEGAVFGAGAFLAGYVTILMITLSGLAASGAELESQDPASWKMAIWSFLGFQGVGLEVDGDPAPISEAAAFGASSILYFLPIVLLGAAGYALVKYVDPDDLQETVKTSVLLVPGYLVLALVFSFVAGHENGDLDVTYGLVTSDAVLYAGILYPVIFGVIGGLLAAWPDPVDKVLEQIESRT